MVFGPNIDNGELASGLYVSSAGSKLGLSHSNQSLPRVQAVEYHGKAKLGVE
jgi:hypothetical protein